MKLRKLILLCVVPPLLLQANLVLLCGQDSQAPPGNQTRYSLTILPTLGGTFGAAWGINNGEAIVGLSTTPDGQRRAFLWRKGAITDLGTLGGPNSQQAFNEPLNNRGSVSGFSDTLTPDPNGEDFCGFGTYLICLPFVWQKGVMSSLPLLGGNNGYAGVSTIAVKLSVCRKLRMRTPAPSPSCRSRR